MLPVLSIFFGLISARKKKGIDFSRVLVIETLSPEAA